MQAITSVQRSADISYVEYGKRFLTKGATDFRLLAFSDEYTASQLDKFRFTLSFPFADNPFIGGIRNVSFALLLRDQGQSSIFVQIQSRRENEIDASSSMVRPFTQIRFTHLENANLYSWFASGLAVYEGLIYPLNQKEPPFLLKDYFDDIKIGEKRKECANYCPIDRALLDSQEVRCIANALINAADPHRTPHPIIVKTHNLDLLQRIRLVQAVQYIVYPYFGVITFALDHITEQGIHLYLLNDPIPGGIRQFGDEYSLDFMKYPYPTFAFDYCTKINRLKFHEYYQLLYGKTFQEHIASSSLDEAVDIVQLVEQLPLPQDQTTIRRVLKTTYTHLVEHRQDLERAFSLLDKNSIQILVRDIRTPPDVELVLCILDYFTQQGWCLRDYLSFHIALPQIARNKNALNILRRVVQQSPESDLESLSQLVHEEKISICHDLIRIRECSFTHSENDKPIVQVPSSAGKKILEALLERRMPESVQVIGSLIEKNNDLLSDCLKALDRLSDPDLFLWFIESLPGITTQIYYVVFAQLIQPQHYSHVILKDKTFQEFLVFGRRLLAREQRDSSQSSPMEEKKRCPEELPILPILTDEKDKDNLLQVVLTIFKQSSVFAEWWFFEEVAFDLKNFRNNYASLINIIGALSPDSRKTFLKHISPQFRYILSRNHPSAEKSLARACRMDIQKSEQANVNLYWTLVDFWFEQDVNLGVYDITLLISLLPDEKANRYLARIIFSPTQTRSLEKLSFTAALRWLKETQRELRTPYIVDGIDRLKEALVHVMPTDEFVWELLPDEPLSPEQMNCLSSQWWEEATRKWQVHLAQYRDIFSKFKQDKQKSKLGAYLYLGQLLSSTPDHLKSSKWDFNVARQELAATLPYRSIILKSMIDIQGGEKNFLDLDDNIRNRLIDIALLENKEQVKDIAKEILFRFLASPELENMLAKISDDNTITGLGIFVDTYRSKYITQNIRDKLKKYCKNCFL
jgi:hypothetical protein